MNPSERKLAVLELGTVDYDRALKLQTALVEVRARDDIHDTLLLLEHPHVYTLGRGADEKFILSAPVEVPIRRVSRGGQVTYHGPGQLVGYPILKLDGKRRDIARYLRMLETAMIDALARCGVSAGRREGFTGVWVGARKIASIGVGIRRWITYHGFALNVATDLSFFNSVVPCGIEGCEMTSIAALGRPEITVAEFSEIMRESFRETFNYAHSVLGDSEAIWRLVDPGEPNAQAHS